MSMAKRILKLLFADINLMRIVKSVRKLFGLFNDMEWADEGLQNSKSGEYESACLCFQNALKLRPACAKYWLELGRCQRLLGQWGMAKDALNRAIELDAKEANAWAEKAIVLTVQDYFQDALIAIENALAIKPDTVEFLLLKAEVLYLLGDYTSPIGIADDVVSRTTWFSKAYALMIRGDCLYRQGKLDEAKAAYREAEIVEPDLPPLRDRLESPRRETRIRHNFDRERTP